MLDTPSVAFSEVLDIEFFFFFSAAASIYRELTLLNCEKSGDSKKKGKLGKNNDCHFRSVIFLSLSLYFPIGFFIPYPRSRYCSTVFLTVTFRIAFDLLDFRISGY
jgi:hypothetical protein